MIVDSVLHNLNGNLDQLRILQDQITSGKRMAAPADDPIAFGRALTLTSALSTSGQHLTTTDRSLDWLNATDAALSSTTSALQRARELAVAGANDTMSTSDRAAMAVEVDRLIQEAVSLGNSKSGGQRLFAGLKTDADPFTLNAGPPTTVTFNGDNGVMLRDVADNATVTINTPGPATFNPAFTSLIQLRDALTSGQAANVQAAISSIDAAVTSVAQTQTAVGTQANWIQTLRSQQQSQQVSLTDQLSKTQDTDLTAAISALTLRQTVYQAGLAAASRSIPQSLFDYLK
jgi:flagellar hook-associated protein 3 FlgL